MSKSVKFFIIFFIGITVCLIGGLFFVDKTFYKQKITIPYLEEPLQTGISAKEKNILFFVKKYHDYDIIITPQARYKVHATVLSKHRYFWCIDGYLAPYDLALGWGKYAKKENYSKVMFLQFGRWYYYFYPSAEFSDVGLYSANTHVVPCNEKVLEGIKKLRKHNEVYMEGYLVDIEAATPKGKTFTWNSSLSRDDSGDGACEIFYVTKLVSEYGIFE